MKFFSEIFQDIDGGYSAKRTAFLVVLLAVVAIVIVAAFHGFAKDVGTFMDGALAKMLEFEKWLGAFIVAEQGSKFASKKDES